MDLQTLTSNGGIVHKNKMFNFYVDQEFVDTELILSDGVIKVHSIVLATESKTAYQLLKSQSGPKRKLKWTRYSKELMRLVVEYMYRGTIKYPTHFKTQLKSLIDFLKLEGTCMKKEQISNKRRIKYETTHNMVTAIKNENSVIVISDEEISDEEISTDCSFIFQTSTNNIAAQIPTIQKQTNFQCDEIQEGFQATDNNLLDTTRSGLFNGDKINSQDEIQHVNSPQTITNTDNIVEYVIDNNNCVPVQEKSQIIVGKHLVQQNIPISNKENNLTSLNQRLGSNGSSNTTFFSLSSETCTPLQPINSESLEIAMSHDEISTPNLNETSQKPRPSKNPYVEMICKKLPKKKKIFNFLPESQVEVEKEDAVSENNENKRTNLQSKEPSRNNREKPRKIITKTKIPNNRNRENEGPNSKFPKLNRKYCLLCERQEQNIRTHLKYIHKEVLRKNSYMCEKCYITFRFEIFRNNHNCR